MSDTAEHAVALARLAAKLAYPRSLVLSTIQNEIDRGRTLFRKVPAATNFHTDDFSEWKQQFGFWDSSVVRSLGLCFTNDAMKTVYEGPMGYSDDQLFAVPTTPSDEIETLKLNLMDRLRRLSAIHKSIPMIPEDAEVIRAWERMHEERERQADAAKNPTARVQPDQPAVPERGDIFIIHGHDEGAKYGVARYVEHIMQSGSVILLDERPDSGRTIIEKFEQESATAGFAIVLVTPDDYGSSKEMPDDVRERARQNVIFELGFFYGQLGRGRVCVLHKNPAEIPSDLHGIIYIEMDAFKGWERKLARELRSANIPISIDNTL
jgi:predicted nucleotide-binding protein